MSFTDEQLRSLAYNDEAPTSTTLLARELIELRARPRDAYHTMEELYEQRMLWHAMAAWAVHGNVTTVTKSWHHHDGQPCFGKTSPGERWFVVSMDLPGFGQVTQHYPERDWDLFDVPAMPCAPPWDGHDAATGNARLRRFLLSR
jgi:hypothetical protein